MFKVIYDEMLLINDILFLIFNCSWIYIIIISVVENFIVIVLIVLGDVVWMIIWDMNICI